MPDGRVPVRGVVRGADMNGAAFLPRSFLNRLYRGGAVIGLSGAPNSIQERAQRCYTTTGPDGHNLLDLTRDGFGI